MVRMRTSQLSDSILKYSLKKQCLKSMNTDKKDPFQRWSPLSRFQVVNVTSYRFIQSLMKLAHRSGQECFYRNLLRNTSKEPHSGWFVSY